MTTYRHETGEGDYLQAKLYKGVTSYHHTVSHAFARWGAFVTKYRWIVLIVMAAVIGAVSAQVIWLRVETNISDLWVDQSSELIDDRDDFEEYFGGLPRKTMIVLSQEDETNVLTPAGLAALQAQLAPYLQASHPDYLSWETTIDGESVTVQHHHVCDRPPVPPRLQPGSATFVGLNGAFVCMSQANELLLGSAAAVTAQCGPLGALGLPIGAVPTCALPNGDPNPALSAFIEAATGVAGVTVPAEYCWNNVVAPAPDFGITRMPCSRSSVLDCFREGAFDLPAEFLQVDFYASLLGRPTTGPFAALSAMNRFATKPSYATMTEAQILKHVSAGLRSAHLGEDSVCANYANVPPLEGSILGGVTPSIDVRALEFEGELTEVLHTRTVVNSIPSDSRAFTEGSNWAVLAKLTDADDREDLMEGWEQVQIDMFEPKFDRDAGSGFEEGGAYAAFTFNFLTWRSNADIADDGSKVDTIAIVIGYVLMIAYLLFALGRWSFPITKWNVVHSRTLSGIFGIVVVALATLATFGFAGIIDIPQSLLSVQVIPLLSLGLGVNDLLVLHHSYHASDAAGAYGTRMAETLAVAGPSVTLTTLANFVAFMVASATQLPAVRWFSQQMAVAVVSNYILLMTVFVAIMSFDAWRIAGKRVDWFPCIAVSGSDEDSQRAEARLDRHGHYISRFFRDVYAPFLESRFGQVFMLTLAIGLLASMSVGIPLVDPGLKAADVALEDTYQADYSNLLRQFRAYDNWVVFEDTDFAAKQSEVLGVMDGLQRTGWLTPEWRARERTLIHSFHQWAVAAKLGAASLVEGYEHLCPLDAITFALDAETSEPVDIHVDEEWFYGCLKHYLRGDGLTRTPDIACACPEHNQPGTTTYDETRPREFRCFEGDTDCLKWGTELTRMRAIDFIYGLRRDPLSHVHAIQQTRDELDRQETLTGVKAYPFGFLYEFWEQYVHIYDTALVIVCSSVAAVFVTVLLFQFSVKTSLIVTITIVVIELSVYGFMGWAGVRLNSVSLVNLVMTIGVTVEFTAHIARAFLTKQGTAEERLEHALATMGSPSFNGALTTFLSIVPIAIYAEWKFFTLYYFSHFSVVIWFSFFYGFSILPLMMYFADPWLPRLDAEEHDEDEENAKL